MPDISGIKNRTLGRIADRVTQKIPVSEQDAMAMLATDDILDLGIIADLAKTAMHGRRVHYTVNANINYTSICELRCPLCAYSRSAGEEGAFTLTLDEIEERARAAVDSGADEVHIVGGLNPDLRLDYFVEMLRRIKRIRHDIFIVAFTAVEYDHFSRMNGISLEEVFGALIDAGLGAIPGGGAEIFSPEKRNIIAPKKITGERWLQVMKIAHRMGLKSNATMLYNHIESPEDIVDHLSRLRAAQEETGGFKAFVPLPFHQGGTTIKPKNYRTGFSDIRIFATARVFLHNIPHLKALWMYLGEKMAQVLLRFGADDISGTYADERVVHSAGAMTPDHGQEAELIRLIKNAGMIPVKTNASYQRSERQP